MACTALFQPLYRSVRLLASRTTTKSNIGSCIKFTRTYHKPNESDVVFVANVDSYGGRIINHDDVMSCSSLEVFASRLDKTLAVWRAEGNGKGVWLEVPVEGAAFVPYAIKKGFEIHHAHKVINKNKNKTLSFFLSFFQLFSIHVDCPQYNNTLQQTVIL
jgi:hypothetical protein